MLHLLLLVTMQVDPGPANKRYEFEARDWITSPAYRFPENRNFAIYFFPNPEDSKQYTELEKSFEDLEKLAKRKDFLVMALTPAHDERLQKFIRKAKVDFAVGCGSDAHKQFKLEKLPKLVILEQGAQQTATWNAIEMTGIESLLPAESDNGLVSGEFNDQSSLDILRQHARFDTDNDQRERAVKILRQRMPTEEFLRLCDEMLAEGDPSLPPYGAIDYQRHLADPSIPEKQARFPASSIASQERRANPTNPKWARIDEFEKVAAQKSIGELELEFRNSSTSDPSDLLIRRTIADELATRSEKADARAIIMRFLPAEPDEGIRLRLVGAMTDVCSPGDREAVQFLEQCLAQEKNIRSVRPLLLTSIRYLNGEID